MTAVKWVSTELVVNGLSADIKPQTLTFDLQIRVNPWSQVKASVKVIQNHPTVKLISIISEWIEEIIEQKHVGAHVETMSTPAFDHCRFLVFNMFEVIYVLA